MVESHRWKGVVMAECLHAEKNSVAWSPHRSYVRIRLARVWWADGVESSDGAEVPRHTFK